MNTTTAVLKPTLTSVELEDTYLQEALAGPNGEWLRLALLQAEQGNVIACAFDARMLASLLSARAVAQLNAEAEMRELRDELEARRKQ